MNNSSKNIASFLQEGSTFRNFMDTLPVLIYAFHADKFVYVNPAFEAALGYSADELLQMNYWEVCHPDFKQIVKERGQARLRGEDVPSHYQIKAIKKNGEIIWADVFFSITQLAGEIVSVVGAYDITEAKELKEELELRVNQRTAELTKTNQELNILNQNLNNVVSNMSDGVIVVSRVGEIELLNPLNHKTWGNLLKYPKETWGKVFNPSNNKSLKLLFEKNLTFQDEEITINLPSSSERFLASGTPMINEQGEVDRALIILRPMQEIHKLVNRFSGSTAKFNFDSIITKNPRMEEVINIARMAASTNSNIIIEGESGTGKEMFAQAIHNNSYRAKGPFIAVNCGAIPRDLIGSELFGYAEGAFTGAKRGGNPGKFELASGGTLFLDEIGDMPLEQQIALLRVIQEKSIFRIGGNQLIPVDVRIVCATNKNLLLEMQKGNFRQDLYYRLNVVSLHIPPLRERIEDIPLLIEYFADKLDPNLYEEIKRSPLIEQLMTYDWPGNVRELQNFVERLVNLPSEKNYDSILSVYPNPRNLFINHQEKTITIHEAHFQKKQNKKKIEKERILFLLNKNQGNITQVAREMGIARSTLYRKMKTYQIDREKL